MLSANLSAGLSGSYNNTRGLVSGAGSLATTFSLALTDGTAAGQADGLFTYDDGIAAGETQSFGLFSGLVDLYGATLEFSAVKIVQILADPNNVGPLIIGGGTWDGPFGDASQTFELLPGDICLRASMGANGYPVDPENDVLQIYSEAQAAYSLSIVGVSTDIYPPACVARPRLLSDPQIGVPLTCYDGDWSGSPTFTYQWKRGGVAIPNATGAGYTPIQADVGSALSRSSVATNAAASILATSNAVTCTTQNDLDLNSGNPLLTAVT